jgi:hypothetical protein
MSNNKKQNNVISLEEREKLDYSKSNLTESGVKILEFMEKKSTAWHIIMIILLFVIAVYLPILRETKVIQSNKFNQISIN